MIVMVQPTSVSLPRVAIIVLNYRGRDCLIPCLDSLTALSYSERDIIVIDNASGDGSLEMAERLFPKLHFVSLRENVGFAGGMNQGIREALTRGADYYDYVWLFNNDAIAEKESLTCLVKGAQENSQAGLLSPLILEKSGLRVWFAAARKNVFRMRAEHTRPLPSLLKQQSYESELLTGCALLLTKEVIKKVGLLDERFFLYYEDADYCMRARQAGLRLLVVPGARVLHSEESEKNNQKVYQLVLSGLLFFGKWATLHERLYLGPYVTIRRIKNATDRLLGRPKALLVAQAYKDFFHGKSLISALFFPRIR